MGSLTERKTRESIIIYGRTGARERKQQCDHGGHRVIVRRGKPRHEDRTTSSQGQSPKQIPIPAPLLPHPHPVLTWILSVTINLSRQGRL